jgi:4-hydroxy-tetrahydrodipicolinate synthase
MARIFSLVADEGKIKEARELYLKYLPVIEFVGGQAYVAGSKALLGHMGFAVGNPRPPRLPLPAAQDAAARALVRSFDLAWRGAPNAAA